MFEYPVPRRQSPPQWHQSVWSPLINLQAAVTLFQRRENRLGTWVLVWARAGVRAGHAVRVIRDAGTEAVERPGCLRRDEEAPLDPRSLSLCRAWDQRIGEA